MNKFKFGIFDLDGSIIDAIPAYTKVFSESLNSKYGIDIKDSRKYYLNSTGTPIDVQFEYMLRKYSKPTDKISQFVDEFFDIVNKIDFILFDNGNPEFFLVIRNGIPSVLENSNWFSTVEFSWSLYKEGIDNYEDETSRGIYEILRELNNLHCVRSLKREVLIYFHFLPMKCFNSQMEEIAQIASMMSEKRKVFAIGEYLEEVRTRKIVNSAEGRARIEGGDFTKKKAPKAMIGRKIGPMFSIKIHYISDSECKVEV